MNKTDLLKTEITYTSMTYDIVIRFQPKRSRWTQLSICDKHKYATSHKWKIELVLSLYFQISTGCTDTDHPLRTSPQKKRKKKKKNQKKGKKIIYHQGHALCCSPTYINSMWCLIEFRKFNCDEMKQLSLKTKDRRRTSITLEKYRRGWRQWPVNGSITLMFNK